MDINKEVLRAIGERKSRFSDDEYTELAAFFRAILELYVSEKITMDSAVDDLMYIATAIDAGDRATLLNTIRTPEQIVMRSDNHPKKRLKSQENWPSKTGNPSGGKRTNAPARLK